MQSDYIVFVDESGDHSMESINPDFPVFVLAFCILRCDAYIGTLTTAVRKLKFELFGHDQVILHEREIRKRSGAFAALGGAQRDQMMAALNQTILVCPMTVVAVVIDKVAHRDRYVRPGHPYHLAMQFGLERVHHVLAEAGQADLATAIVCECRGAKEDTALELEAPGARHRNQRAQPRSPARV